MKESPENMVNSGSENDMSGLSLLKQNLKLKKDEYEQMEFLLTAETEHKVLENNHRECAEFCRLERKKLKKLHKIKKVFHPVPAAEQITSASPVSNPPDPPKTEKANIFCPSMPLSVSRNHFKVLTENNSKNGKPFLTPDQLDSFIDMAFCGNQDLPVQKINLDLKGETIKVQNVFYAFYCKTVKDYFPTDNCRDKFITLLTDNFTGWDFEKVKKNFSKHTKHCFKF
jgi:hypothetical protein